MKIMLVLMAFSAGLYLLFAAASLIWRLRERRKNSERVPGETYPSYFWGLTFALVFYYGFPVWWWRYGLENTCRLIVSCILAVAALQGLVRYLGLIEVDELGESIAVSLVLAVPVRAVAAFWIAKNDHRWRQGILSKRKAAKLSGADG